MLHSHYRTVLLCTTFLAIGVLVGYFYGIHHERRDALLSAPIDHLTEIVPITFGIIASDDPISAGLISLENEGKIIIGTNVSLNEEENVLVLSEYPWLCEGDCVTFSLTLELLQGIPLFEGGETPLTLGSNLIEDFSTYNRAEVYVVDYFDMENSIEKIVFF